MHSNGYSSNPGNTYFSYLESIQCNEIVRQNDAKKLLWAFPQTLLSVRQEKIRFSFAVYASILYRVITASVFAEERWIPEWTQCKHSFYISLCQSCSSTRVTAPAWPSCGHWQKLGACFLYWSVVFRKNRLYCVYLSQSKELTSFGLFIDFGMEHCRRRSAYRSMCLLTAWTVGNALMNYIAGTCFDACRYIEEALISWRPDLFSSRKCGRIVLTFIIACQRLYGWLRPQIYSDLTAWMERDNLYSIFCIDLDKSIVHIFLSFSKMPTLAFLCMQANRRNRNEAGFQLGNFQKKNRKKTLHWIRFDLLGIK